MKPTPIQLRIESLCRINRQCGIRTAASLADLKPDAQSVIFGHSIAGAVIHRINFPKVAAGKVSRNSSLAAKLRPLLSPEEEKDAKQTVALVLVATGALERGRLTLGDWKEVFRAVRGANCLRIDRQAKNKSEIIRIDTLSPEAAEIAAVTLALPTLPATRRKVIAKRVRYMREQMLATFRGDTSRKRKNSYRKARCFLRFTLSHYKATGAWGHSEISKGNTPASFRMAAMEFRDYCEKGETIMTAESLAFTPAKVERAFRAFADIPANFAIAD